MEGIRSPPLPRTGRALVVTASARFRPTRSFVQIALSLSLARPRVLWNQSRDALAGGTKGPADRAHLPHPLRPSLSIRDPQIACRKSSKLAKGAPSYLANPGSQAPTLGGVNMANPHKGVAVAPPASSARRAGQGPPVRHLSRSFANCSPSIWYIRHQCGIPTLPYIPRARLANLV
jgi:hypothetical protein